MNDDKDREENEQPTEPQEAADDKVAEPQPSGADADATDKGAPAEPAPEPKPLAAKKKAAAKPVAVTAPVPLVDRPAEIRAGLGLAAAGLLVFWLGWSSYERSMDAKHVNFYSNSAWIFLIAFVLVTISAFTFLRYEDREKLLAPDWAGGNPYRKHATRPDAKLLKPKVERNGLLLALLVWGPFYGVYWWKAATVLHQVYPSLWWLVFVPFIVVSYGAFYGLKPPSIDDELRRRIPDRRVIMLLMVPFSLVFGMIWLAGLYPPWPG